MKETKRRCAQPGKAHGEAAARHGRRVVEALAALRRPEHKLQITDLPLPCDSGVISVIGIKDNDRQRNLGDYQNISYFLIREDAPQTAPPADLPAPEAVGVEGEPLPAVVIDPGLRDADWIRKTLGITTADVIFSHFHLDHWIGYEPYRGQPFYASPLCKMVLTQMVGVERTGRSIFAEGRLTEHHSIPLPLRAANDAERLLPVREEILTVTGDEPYRNSPFALEFFELPYGQTEGTIYGLLDTGAFKVLFAGDLFVQINGQLKIEPHYAFKSKAMVIRDVIVMLRSILGKNPRVPAGPVIKANLAKVTAPDILAMGHGLITFQDVRTDLEHLLAELEEMIRINNEHII